MAKFRRYLFSVISGCGLVLLAGCSFFGDSVQPLAAIGDAELYPDDVNLGMPSDISAEDSAQLMNSYIKNWCVEQLMYEKAKESVTDLDEVEILVEKYRRSLIIYEYQLQLISQNLSKPITTTQVQKFYTDNQELYTAHETLFQGLLITVPTMSSALPALKAQVRQSEITMVEIDRIINKYSLNVKYFDDQWTPIAAVKHLGMYHISRTHDFGRAHYVEETDEENTYLLIVQDYIAAGAPQPFDYVKERIVNMLTEQRKADYLRDLSDNLYKEALDAGKIKLSNNNKKQQ